MRSASLPFQLVGLFLALACVSGTPARADPCTGELPSRAGQAFTGTVRHVGDGDSLCVGAMDDPGTWIEVRLADFDAPELHSSNGPRAKAFLELVALG